MCSFYSDFDVKYIIEILAQRKIFKEENPILRFIFKEKFDETEEFYIFALKKIKNQIPGWLMALHLDLLNDSCIFLELEKLESEILKKCKKTQFGIDLRLLSD